MSKKLSPALQRKVIKFKGRYHHVELHVVGMAFDPNPYDPGCLTAAEGVGAEPIHWDTSLFGYDEDDGLQDDIDLVSEATEADALAMAEAVASVLGIDREEIVER